jgi:hypothetical protein
VQCGERRERFGLARRDGQRREESTAKLRTDASRAPVACGEQRANSQLAARQAGVLLCGLHCVGGVGGGGETGVEEQKAPAEIGARRGGAYCRSLATKPLNPSVDLRLLVPVPLDDALVRLCCSCGLRSSSGDEAGEEDVA